MNDILAVIDTELKPFVYDIKKDDRRNGFLHSCVAELHKILPHLIAKAEFKLATDKDKKSIIITSTNYKSIADQVSQYLELLGIDFQVKRNTYAFTDSLYSKFNDYNDKINAEYVFVLNSLYKKSHDTKHILITKDKIEYCRNKTTYLMNLLNKGRYLFFSKKVQISDCYRLYGVFIAPGGSSTQIEAIYFYRTLVDSYLCDE